MRVLFIVDPLQTLNLATETSVLLMEELAARGHEVFGAEAASLHLAGDEARVRAQRIAVVLGRPVYDQRWPAAEHAAGDFGLILMRKDPPVDAAYLAATFVLEHAARDVPVVNDPVALRTVNEKLLALELPEFAPPTLVSADPERLGAFAAAHRRIVLKPLADCSGRGIKVVEGGDREVVTQYLRAHGGGFVIAQKFLAGVAAGDKRIFLLAGKPLGAVNRVPCGPGRLANIHQGARVERTILTPRELDIVAAVKPLLVQRGLWLAGLDVIDGHLIEINVTSPSAARQINAVSGSCVEVPIVDFLERHAENGAGPWRRSWLSAAEDAASTSIWGWLESFPSRGARPEPGSAWLRVSPCGRTSEFGSGGRSTIRCCRRN